ncbi:MAG: FAD-dependent oxidoreductase [Lachnospiraceae bacterium]|jgi:uncharacterized FAD-dependent dehydrogenase|nr:FAD-dependent oxidoreductase [Lachnospiraceae bacterium]
MSYKIQIKLKIPHTQEALRKAIIKGASDNNKEAFKSYKIIKKSIDARKKPKLFNVYQVEINPNNEKSVYNLPERTSGSSKQRPIIVGFGPAGIFCAYALALRGLNPIVLERGAKVEDRQVQVENFWQSGVLNAETNVQFGEGGAGAFSDGKLNSGIKDKSGRIRFVLETLVKYGAPEEILISNQPHIGTDILKKIVKNLREEICRLGGEIRFLTKVTDLREETGRNCNTKLVVRCKTTNILDVFHCNIHTDTEGESEIETDTVVFAIGHSARDTFEMLEAVGLETEDKSFAVGFRIMHPQSLINEAQYGIQDPILKLPAASYKLTANLPNGRGVYTFCMCPGGYVVNAASEIGGTVVNGMSYHGRGGENANSAVVVTINPMDYAPFGGVGFQRQLEKRAYEVGEGKIPVQRFSDLINNQRTISAGDVNPQCKGLYEYSKLNGLLPEEIETCLIMGIKEFDKKIKGFAHPDALLAGVESRTSSPIRFLRNDRLETSIKGVYVTGEGSGYAGGIMSSAVDGLKVAERVILG